MVTEFQSLTVIKTITRHDEEEHIAKVNNLGNPITSLLNLT
jgi:hypothetical protein